MLLTQVRELDFISSLSQMQLACANICEPATHTQALYGSLRDFICGAQVKYDFLSSKSRDLLYKKSGRLGCHSMKPYHLGVQRRTCLSRASLSRTEGELGSEVPGGQHKIPTLREKTINACLSYPWEKLCVRFLQRVLDLAWIATKWLAIPVFVLSTLSEFVYTLAKGKDIFIPLGILSGVLLAKVIGNAFLDFMRELQDGRAALPLTLLGLFFLLLKLPGPYYPSWAAAFIPHMANAGLVKTVFLFREWQRKSL